MRTQLTGLVGALLVLAGILSGCASTSAQLGQAGHHPTRSSADGTASRPPIVTWFHRVNPAISTVEQSITYAQFMVRHPNLHGLRPACRAIKANVRAATAAQPVPDRIARAAIAEEMNRFKHAADACLQGRLESAGRLVNQGHHYAQIAWHRVVRLLHAAGARRGPA